MAVREQSFMKCLMIAIGARPDLRIHRQNTGKVRAHREGRDIGMFEAGPPNGASDLSGICYPGFRIEIETKSAKAKTGAAQEAWAAMITRFGGIAVRVRYSERLTMSENIEDAVLAIDQAIEARRQKQQPRRRIKSSSTA